MFPPLRDARNANEVRFEVELGERAVLGQCPGQGDGAPAGDLVVGDVEAGEGLVVGG